MSKHYLPPCKLSKFFEIIMNFFGCNNILGSLNGLVVSHIHDNDLFITFKSS